MSKAEVMLIMILFHDSGYRCLKHFYPEKVCRHLRLPLLLTTGEPHGIPKSIHLNASIL